MSAHISTFPARVKPPREALQPFCAWCGEVPVENEGDFCAACTKPSLHDRALAANCPDQATLEAF